MNSETLDKNTGANADSTARLHSALAYYGTSAGVAKQDSTRSSNSTYELETLPKWPEPINDYDKSTNVIPIL
jgi:hypothetical protein